MMKIHTVLPVLLLLLFIALNCTNTSNVKEQDEIYIASWNVENLFDTYDEEFKIDEWFTPSSEINWTDSKLNKKIKNLSKVIGDMNNGLGPDILGLQEVENKQVLKLLVHNLNLNRSYEIAHYESPDKRGIDVALIYDREIFEFLKSEPVLVELEDNKTTRDILYVNLKFQNEPLHIFVNHWPSRREGLKKTEKRRIKASETLISKITNISKATPGNIVILGDFNDMPSNLSIKSTLGAVKFDCEDEIPDSVNYLNLSYVKFQKGEGTYKYRGHWNMLDQIIISRQLFDGNGLEYDCNSFQIIKPGYLIQKDGKYRGTSLPTYGGRKYLGGFSDHFSIGAKFYISK